jgi:hypothetical protein
LLKEFKNYIYSNYRISDEGLIVDIDIIHKEIDLVQACICRMSKNSFLIKGWSITITGILLTIAQATSRSSLLVLTILLPLLCFWYLDAYFLRLERMYRKLYEWILVARQNGDKSFLYDLNPHRFSSEVESISKTMLSCSIRYYYCVPIVLTIFIIITI